MKDFATTWACQSGAHCFSCRNDERFCAAMGVVDCPRNLPMGYDPVVDTAIYILGERENPTMATWLAGQKNVTRWPAFPRAPYKSAGWVAGIVESRNAIRSDFMASGKRFMLQLDDDLLPDERLLPLLRCSADVAAPAVWRNGHVQHQRQPLSANALRLSRRACEVAGPFTEDKQHCECVMLWRAIQKLLPKYPWLRPVRLGEVDHPNADGSPPQRPVKNGLREQRLAVCRECPDWLKDERVGKCRGKCARSDLPPCEWNRKMMKASTTCPAPTPRWSSAGGKEH